MDTTSGQPPAAVIETLLARPKTFSFIQAVRLLVQANRGQWADGQDFLRHGLKIRPHLSLAHPGTDIVDIGVRAPEKAAPEEAQERAGLAETGRTEDRPAAGAAPDTADPATGRMRYAMTVTFLSLYGASSPLPTFYTEELIEEAREDHDESRTFLDIFNQALYVLYYRAFNACKIGQRTLEDADSSVLLMQEALLGMGLGSLRDRAELSMADWACMDLYIRSTRTAEGLARIVQILTGARHVEVEQCVLRIIPIAPDQQARLGRAQLGADVIGREIRDCEGAFRLHIHSLEERELPRFLPGGPPLRTITAAVRRYLTTPLAWDLVLHVAPRAAQPGGLGACRLGRTSFLCEKASQERCYHFSQAAVLQGLAPRQVLRGTRVMQDLPA